MEYKTSGVRTWKTNIRCPRGLRLSAYWVLIRGPLNTIVVWYTASLRGPLIGPSWFRETPVPRAAMFFLSGNTWNGIRCTPPERLSPVSIMGRKLLAPFGNMAPRGFRGSSCRSPITPKDVSPSDGRKIYIRAHGYTRKKIMFSFIVEYDHSDNYTFGLESKDMLVDSKLTIKL